MPIYEYVCEQCGQQAEQLVRAGADPKCPSCGSERLQKLLSIVAAPTRGESTGRDLPPGPCGASCACHPHG